MNKNPIHFGFRISNFGLLRRRRGAVMVVVLVSLTLLAGLLFFVLNLGDQVNRRIDMQSAADTAATGGAGWMARSMNLVAMNNVAMTRQIALVAVMDSLPVAAEMTIAEQTGPEKLSDALQKYSSPGSAFTPYERYNFFRLGLAEIFKQLNTGSEEDPTSLDWLYQLDDAFDQGDERDLEDAYDVAGDTQWLLPDEHEDAGGRGKIWRAIVAMDELSQAAVNSAGKLAQAQASELARANGASIAFVVPLSPSLPAVRTSFEDFAPVMVDHIEYRQTAGKVRRSGLLDNLQNSTDTAQDIRELVGRGWYSRVKGGAIPDDAPAGLDNVLIPNHRLGPFAQLLRWRINDDERTYDFERRLGYNTYGPLEDALLNVAEQFGQAGTHAGGELEVTNFARHLRCLATMKIAYMLGLASPQKAQYADKWIADMQEARNVHAQDPNEIMTTRYYRVVIKSTIPWDSADWMNPEAWQDDEPTADFVPMRWFSWQLPSLEEHGPYNNPTTLPVGRWIADQAGWGPIDGAMPYAQARAIPWQDHPFTEEGDPKKWIEIDSSGEAWYCKWKTTPLYDPKWELDLPRRYREVIGDDDQPMLVEVPYEIYYIEFRVFGGAECRDEFDLSNPAEGASPADLPAPMLLDKELADYDPEPSEEPGYDTGQRREMFSYLGVARGSGGAKAWPDKFTNDNPAGAATTLAQAIVFNNTSWDLWTQDWQCKLVPVTKWSDWTAKLAAQAGGELPGPQNQEQIQQISDYLQTIDPKLMDAFMDH